jgi:hypothetical protein
MASITTILGTDSIASSRVVINDNFSSINDQVLDIADLLDVSSQTLTLTGNINAKELNLVNGSSLFKVNASDIVASVPLTVEKELVLQGGLVNSITGGATGSGITSMPAVNDYTKSTYVLDGSQLNTPNIVQAGADGQSVTFIASGIIEIDDDNIAGVTTNIVISDNGTLTLRCFGGNWYVIAYSNAVVTY